MEPLARIRSLLDDGMSFRPEHLLRRPVCSPIHLCNLVESLDLGGKTNRIATVCNGLDSKEFMTSCLCLGSRGSMSERFEPRVQVWALHQGGHSGTDMLPALRDMRDHGPHLGTIWQVAQVLRRYRVDLLHTHSWTTLVCGLAAARLARVSSVVHTVHEDSIDGLGTIRRASWLARRLTDQFIAVSGLLADRLAQQVGIPREKILVLPTGVSTERFRPPHDPLLPRLTLGIDPDQFVFGTVAQLERAADFSLLLEAAAQLRQQGFGFSCLVIGEGPAVETLRNRARELGIHEQLLFAGFSRDVPTMLAAMDLFVFPCSTTGVPSALLEAMACGLPVVAVNGGSVTEVIRDGDTGLLVPEGQPKILARIIGQLVDGEKRRSALGKRAREHVEGQLSARQMTGAYAEMYQGLVNRKS
jgi:glycosyltransferase involved in cell wall biosynthesis